jgi:murein L,D-transpeptidase YafK
MTLRVPFLLVALVLGFALYGALRPRPLPPLSGQIDHILIDKSDRELVVFRDGRALRRYTVSLGFAPEGDKERQGDGRTPEGQFRIDRRNSASRFHLSLGIDYPQPDDVARAAAGGYSPGGDIFIHGQPRGVTGRMRIARDWTEGCIAVTNATMDELWRVTPVGTTVEIRP